ncbi:MAG TPA: DUF3775 domain-containing protein [Kiloniellales bacterium]|jgi:hypothetical protein|nr:DUF3775 domain-containing protein [Kiloniellales bacterium]
MLHINPDKVCFIILRVRELQQEDLIEDPEDEEDVDAFDLDHQEAFDELDGHEALEANPLQEELEGFIEGLSEEEKVELVALTWVGRGDFTHQEWDEATEAAADRQNERTVDYLLGIPNLADYLAEALDAFGYSCADFDEGRM